MSLKMWLNYNYDDNDCYLNRSIRRNWYLLKHSVLILNEMINWNSTIQAKMIEFKCNLSTCDYPNSNWPNSLIIIDLIRYPDSI